MDQQQFRGVIAVVLCVALAAGLYLGWHYTHPPCPRWQGAGHPYPQC